MKAKNQTVDLKGLPENQIWLVKEFVEFLKLKTQMGTVTKKTRPQKMVFATHRSDVKGNLTREEIYGYLLPNLKK